MTGLILSLAIKASLIMGVGAVAAIALRTASAAGRHLVWTGVVVALLVLPALAVVAPTLIIPVQSAGVVDRVAGVVVQSPSRPAAETPMRVAPAATTAPVATIRWGVVLAAIYSLGVLAWLLRLIVERLAVRRIRRNTVLVADAEWLSLLEECRHDIGVPSRVQLLRSLDRAMPMTFGVFEPAILIPSIADSWSADRRRAVLSHELAHIARRDCLTQLLASITCALYWMHPGAWLIARRLRVERELACDDCVLSTGTTAGDYAQHLLELAYSFGNYRAPALVVSMARPKQLEGRMLAALDHARNRTAPARRSRIAGALIIGALVMPLAAVEIHAVPAAATVVTDSAATQRTGQIKERRDIQLPGTWELGPGDTPKIVNLTLRERRNSVDGFDIAIGDLDGLSASVLAGPSANVKFNLHRDAGTLVFEGTVRAGVGAGTFTFVPSPTFAAEMTKRGYTTPDATDMYILARGDIGVSYLDELAAQKYERPELNELLRASDHGATYSYLRDMGRAGYRLGQLEALIKSRDHGVDREFIDGLTGQGLTGLSYEQVVRARDHGVEPEYIAGLKSSGLSGLSFDDLVRARDHGVGPAYIQGMRSAGLALPDLDGLIQARDHGVDAAFIAGLATLGYKNLSLTELVRMRDHGVTPEWVMRQNTSSRSRLSVDELVRRRDRGGDE